MTHLASAAALAYPTMEPAPKTTWIKDGLHRRAGFREGTDGRRRFVKRFRASSWWRRLRDGRRARRELELAGKLRAGGLAVPEVYGVARRGGAWELDAEAIEGARGLDELVAAPGELPRPKETLARALGELVARAHALGLDHGDLHAGNLVVDARGEAWLVDLGSSRLLSRSSAEGVERDLVALAADTRERVPLDTRRRFFVAWRRALAREAGELPLEPALLARRVEEAALRRRREALLEHADRWLRPSGLCRRVPCGIETALLRRGSVREEVAARLLDGEPGRVEDAELDGEGWLVEGPGESTRLDWVHLGRAEQHGLPGLRPLALFEGRPARALYLAPASARPGELGRPPALDASSALRRALEGRGLRLADEQQLWTTPSGEALLGPGSRLEIARAGNCARTDG